VNPEDMLAAIAALPVAFTPDSTPEASLATAAALALALIPACDAVGITLVGTNDDAAAPGTAAATDSFAVALDTLQYDLADGPTLTAMDTGVSCLLIVEGGDGRWPKFAAKAGRLGLAACLAAPIQAIAGSSGRRPAGRVPSAPGALSLYSKSARFGDHDAVLAGVLAAAVSLGLASADAVRYAGEQAEQLTQALASRDTIGQAKGILMAREGCTPDEAFDMLRRASQRLNQKLRVVAEQIVQSVADDPADVSGPDDAL
jgi:hypothetical protein